MSDFTNAVVKRLRDLLHPLVVGYHMRTSEPPDPDPNEEVVAATENMLIEDIFMIFREEKENYQKNKK